MIDIGTYLLERESISVNKRGECKSKIKVQKKYWRMHSQFVSSQNHFQLFLIILEPLIEFKFSNWPYIGEKCGT